jgi:hypothetical protein
MQALQRQTGGSQVQGQLGYKVRQKQQTNKIPMMLEFQHSVVRQEKEDIQIRKKESFYSLKICSLMKIQKKIQQNLQKRY